MSADGKDKPELPTEAELAEMDRDELATLGMKLDGVELVEYPDPWPVKGTRAEKRAERAVALWFAIAALSGLAFLVAFLWWPWKYVAPNESGYFAYSLYTPVLGFTLGLSIVAVGVGVMMYTKKFVPHEVAVQERHDGGSSELDKKTIVAQLSHSGTNSTIARRSMIKRAAGAGVGVVGLAATVFPIAGLVRNPHAKADGKDGVWHTGWKSENGERVFLRRNTGNPHDVVLVKPGDLDAGSMETVFPFRKSEEHDQHALSQALKRGDNPVMLIRLRTEDARKVVKHEGQEDFNYGDFYAYTKICSHLGCPTSLYEQRTNRILCPCHQSQFDALEYAKPIFGPATRKLAQLPIAVDEETGYFYARSDFIEAVGPAFWERKS
ncbi:menaquinol-cytochrome c reductase iron-sulfur subunit precursor [Herbihabitans rhizosphaerae]|uniref:Cytochrome bc1 complex Rieske iron-sulfur subunit n=1 Tax=Herbihabitans rhizosphaerae TaxID=1872711 RepID=A0A4Q7KTX0_9PSEU|nr:ubiquinol-cytochrome c reductase iron-sulfur subunit [Herbihabitans rhizosphaerae]RZS38892.1 menaquinol-cytochrome c reductase iron-sulfur subunit precursor [Herbihabitans rhizosphaerae]